MAQSVMSLLHDINNSGTTIVMVTHDPSLAEQAKRNIFVRDGRVNEAVIETITPKVAV